MRVLLVPALGIVAALAACQAKRPQVPPTETPRTAAGCANAGGMWQRAGMLGIEQCIFTYADGGKICATGSDCQGDCRVVDDLPTSTPMRGRCQPTTSPFGCYATIENGKVEEAICVD